MMAPSFLWIVWYFARQPETIRAIAKTNKVFSSAILFLFMVSFLYRLVRVFFSQLNFRRKP